MKQQYIYLFISCLFCLNACKKEQIINNGFVVAFHDKSVSFLENETNKSVEIVYSTEAQRDGVITIELDGLDMIYGEDYVTIPAANNGKLSIPIYTNSSISRFEVKKLNNPSDQLDPKIFFEIVRIQYPKSIIQGNSILQLSLTPMASLGTQIVPEVGGSNEPNQVFVDLATEHIRKVKRDTWDLAFSSKNDYHVRINGSIYVAAGALNTSAINSVSETQVSTMKDEVVVGNFDPNNIQYIDAPSGNRDSLAIGDIAINDSQNKVFLLNLGYDIGTSNAAQGSVAIAGSHRGWKKIRILRSGNDYILQYADLNATTYQSVTITKQAGQNYVYFSFETNSTVSVAPSIGNWDLKFTVFTNVYPGNGSYGFADFVVANRDDGIVGYAVNGDLDTYQNFSLSDVLVNDFKNDQRFIGSSWREGGGPGYSPSLRHNIFFVIKDFEGNIYKLRFTALMNLDGERGHPSFEYELLK